MGQTGNRALYATLTRFAEKYFLLLKVTTPTHTSQKEEAETNFVFAAYLVLM